MVLLLHWGREGSDEAVTLELVPKSSLLRGKVMLASTEAMMVRRKKRLEANLSVPIRICAEQERAGLWASRGAV
jgi:hypothetical protein